MRAVVTGALGFIGSHIVDRLVNKGYLVYGIDDMSGGSLANANPKADYQLIDCRDYDKLEDTMRQIRPEIVFHLAANAAENKAQFSPVDVTSRNYDAFIKVLTSSLRHGMKRIVVTSSIAVYGAIEPPFKESDRPEPEDLYGLSKLQMEESLKILSRVHNFEYVITRPHNVYGPRQNMTDPYRNVMTIFMNQILKDENYNIYGDGEQQRCFSYIDPVADAIVKAGLEAKSKEIYNIGSDNAYTLNYLSELLQTITQCRSKPVYLPERPQEVKFAVSDHTKAAMELGYKDYVSFEDGVKKTWEWAKTMGPQPLRYTELEITNDKLPANWKK